MRSYEIQKYGKNSAQSIKSPIEREREREREGGIKTATLTQEIGGDVTRRHLETGNLTSNDLSDVKLENSNVATESATFEICELDNRRLH